MVGTGTMIVMGLLAVLTAVVPLGVMLLLRRRGGRWGAFWTGVGTFFLFALVLEAMFHQLVLGSPLGAAIRGNIWLYALYGGLAAGIFEETARLVAFRMVLRSETEPVTALSYGLGHGGMEALLVVGTAMVNNLLMGALLLQGGQPPVELAAAAETLASTPAIMFLWSALERVSALVLHVSNAVLVFAAVRTGRWVLFPAAILTHAGLNFLAVVSGAYLPMAATEALILIFALLVGLWAVKIYRNDLKNCEIS